MIQKTHEHPDERIFSKAAEAAVVASVIIDPDCITVVCDIVSANDFYFPEYKIIFQTVLRLRDDDKPIDGVLVRDRLEERKRLDEIGGVEFLRDVLESVPSSANAKHYAEIVKEKAQRRRLYRAVEKIHKVIDSDRPVGKSVSEIKEIAAGLDGAIQGCADSQAIIKNLSGVESLPIEWFWFNTIPAGMLTLLIGDPGLGKSFLSLYMASKVSTGDHWPNMNGDPCNSAPQGSAVLLTAEDDLPRVIKPRLDAMGADTSKILALEGVRATDEDGRQRQESFCLQWDLPALQHVIENQKDVKLIVVDPISAYLGNKVDSHRDADVRSVLMPLVDLAECNNIAVVGIMHLNKDSGRKAVYRALGSVAFTAAARTVWLVSKDPDEPDSRRRLFTPAKHNVLIEPHGLAFEIIDGQVIFENEPVDITADEALGQGSTVVSIEKDRAVDWLREILPAGTSLATTEVSRMAKELHISEATLRRAKKGAGVVSYPLAIEGKHQWFLEIRSEDALNKSDEQH
ncbi:AAA family ATPase [Planctomycetota bacterium]